MEQTISCVVNRELNEDDMIELLLKQLQNLRSLLVSVIGVTELSQSKERLECLIKRRAIDGPRPSKHNGMSANSDMQPQALLDDDLSFSDSRMLQKSENAVFKAAPERIIRTAKPFRPRSPEQSQLMSSNIIDETNSVFCKLCLIKSGQLNSLKNSPRYKTGPTGKRLMTRMNQLQRNSLKREFELNANWTQEKVEEIAETLNISKAKVYKWNWDQKNKQRDALYIQSLSITEVPMPQTMAQPQQLDM